MTGPHLVPAQIASVLRYRLSGSSLPGCVRLSVYFNVKLKRGLVVASTLQIIYSNSAGEEGEEPEVLYKECVSGL